MYRTRGCMQGRLALDVIDVSRVDDVFVSGMDQDAAHKPGNLRNCDKEITMVQAFDSIHLLDLVSSTAQYG